LPAPSKEARKLPGLRRAREARGFSQRRLGGVSGVSNVNISRIEGGQPAMIKTAKKLARALSVPVEELIGYGSSREGLLDMAGFVRSLGFEPEPYFTEVRLPSEEIHKLYEATYVRLLKAEKRFSEERWDEPFDQGLGEYLVDLAEAEETRQPSLEDEGLRDRVRAMARRVAAVYAGEAERLANTEARIIDLAARERPTPEPSDTSRRARTA
jgi:transcriptional regulator with XRE-family HTH domain